MACLEGAGDGAFEVAEPTLGFLDEALAGAGNGAFIVAESTLGFRDEVLDSALELGVGDSALEILFISRSKSFNVIFFF